MERTVLIPAWYPKDQPTEEAQGCISAVIIVNIFTWNNLNTKKVMEVSKILKCELGGESMHNSCDVGQPIPYNNFIDIN